MKRFISEWVPMIAVLLMARGALADHYMVPSGSMEPTVSVGDRVIVDKRAYGLRVPGTQMYLVRYAAPAPGEVVVLDSPQDERVLLKRVTAGEGMVVEVRGGKLTLDGEEQAVIDGVEQLGEHPHRVVCEPFGGPDFGPVRVPPGKSLVMGDNRGNSYDGRSFGFVDNDAILGRAQRIYWHHSRPAWSALEE